MARRPTTKTTKRTAASRKIARKAPAKKAAPAKAKPEEAEEEDEEQPQGGSVVPKKYRDEYAARGHAAHCGDELAYALNDRCQDANGKLDVASFVNICKLNGVNVDKYLKNTRGWQGRLRMSGRNMLRKVVKANGGVLKTPEGDVKLKAYA